MVTVGKQSQAQQILGEVRAAGENIDTEDVISKTIALTSPNANPRLYPSNPKLAYADRPERFSLAHEILTKIAYPKTSPGKKVQESERKVVVSLDPKDKKSEKWEEADEKTQKFREDVKRAGFINLDKFHQEYLDHQGLLPEKLQGTEITAALNLYARGAKSSEIEQKAEASQGLMGNEKDYLLRTSYFIACFEEANLKAGLPATELLQTANLSSEVTDIKAYDFDVEAKENQFVFASDGGSLTPIIPFESQPSQAVLDIQGTLKDIAFDAIEKGGKKLVKKELKAIEKKGLQTVEKAAAKKAAGIAAKAGVKLAVKGTTMAVAEAAGTAVPIIGNIVAWLAVEIGDKLISLAKKAISKIKKWIQENPEVLIGLGVAAIIGGLLLHLIPLTILGIGSILLTGLPIASVVGGIIGGVLAFVSNIFVQMAVIFGTVATFLLLFIMLVIFIFYIITTGGYVVPYWNNDAYSPYNVNQENPYIGVGKIADPKAADDPVPVTYTITITAKRGNLTNLQITNYTCEVIKKDGSHIDCPSTQPPPLPPDLVVAVNTAYSFTYTVNYGLQYDNALVVDTITITGDAPSQPGVSSTSSAGVCFGDCPEDCPSGWPVGPEGGETQLQVTQGPYSPVTHRVLDGVDITNMDDSNRYQSFNGHTIRATHSGLFCAPPGDVDAYGSVVYIVGQCNGQQFASVYAHIMTGSAMIPSGSHVTKGQSIAHTDDTGGWNFPHLHYEFAQAGGDGTTCSGFWAQPPGMEPNMTTIYGVPQFCFWNCGVFIH
jgi:hypothetical protein